jgi:uncharacterized protein DUF4349
MRRKFGLAVISFLAVAGMVGAACSGGGKMAGGTMPTEVGDAAAKGGLPAPAPARGSSLAGGTPAVVGEFQLPGIGQRIIKTANVSIQVKKASFQQRFQQAAMVASTHGGFVSSSRTDEGKRRSGLLIIRIPAGEFEAAMGELKALGVVRSEQVSGQDVTAKFVDLQARLRNWEAQETVLLRLMRQSRTIEDSLKVQRTLQDVQLAIEEIRGQLRVLSDQTDLSTITLSMTEAGAVVPKPKQNEGLTFARAWHQAVHAIAVVLAAIVIGLGYLIPIALVALVLLVAWFGFRRVRPRMAGGTPSGTA